MFAKLLSLVFLSFVIIAPAAAADTSGISAPSYPYMVPPQTYAQTFGQNQYYSVVFDGESEAAVAAKLTFQNTTNDTISTVNIEIPGTSVRLITAAEETSPQPCPFPYPYQEKPQSPQNYPPCIYNYYSTAYYYAITPQEDHLSESTKVTLLLPSQIQPQGQFSILLYYKAMGYVKKHAGLFKFTFSTIKMPYDIQNTRVAINVQEGLYLAGGKAETNYRPNFAPLATPTALPAAGSTNQALSDFSQRIAYEEGFVKQTSGLDPWESFSVKGRYAASHFILILPVLVDAFISIAVALLILGIAFFKLKKLVAAKQKHRGGIAASLFFPGPWIWAGLTGSGAALFTVMAMASIQWLSTYLNRYVGYGSFSQLFSMLLTLSLIGFNLIIFFGVPVYFWRRHRWSVGLFAFGVELAALFLVSLIALLVLSSPSVILPPVPLEGGGVGPMLKAPHAL